MEKPRTNKARTSFPKLSSKKGRTKTPESCPQQQCPASPSLLPLKNSERLLCQHSYCLSRCHVAEDSKKASMGCHKGDHIYLDLNGLLHLQMQPQSYWQRREKQDCAITRILHHSSFSSAKSSPSGSAAPICKS